MTAQRTNWRPLISIADACSHERGRQARVAAVALSAGLNHEDQGVTLLGDIRQVFDARGGERFFSQVLVDALVAMEGARSEWRGKGNRQPRPLTQVRLADMLHDFDIAPMSISSFSHFDGAPGLANDGEGALSSPSCRARMPSCSGLQ